MSYEKSGSAHKVASIILRLGQISCAAIVIGILARFSYLLSIQQVHEDGRLVYAMVVAGISIIYSFLLCPPFRNLFMSFPCDFVLFVMWLVAYCLLQTVWPLSCTDRLTLLRGQGLLTGCDMNRDRRLTHAPLGGIVPTGATTGVVTGVLAVLESSTSAERDVHNGGQSWHSLSLLGLPTCSAGFW